VAGSGNSGAAMAVLKAFRAAEAAGLAPAECYRAGVEAWKSLHPDHSAAYAARRAVEIILEERKGAIMWPRQDAARSLPAWRRRTFP
jgi:hypothetical protein